MRSAGGPAFAKLLKTIRTNLPVYHDPYFGVRLIRGGLGSAKLRSTRIYTTVSDIHSTAKIAKEGTLGLYLSNIYTFQIKERPNCRRLREVGTTNIF